MQEASKRRCNKIKLLSLSFVSKLNTKLSGIRQSKNDKEASCLLASTAIKTYSKVTNVNHCRPIKYDV